MNSRLNYGKIAPGVYEAVVALDRYVQTCAMRPAGDHLQQGSRA
jgi:hypothetical protein